MSFFYLIFVKYILIIIAIIGLGSCGSNAQPAKKANDPKDSVVVTKQPENWIEKGGRLAKAVQCTAKTKSGAQCKKKTKNPDLLCNIHYR